MNMTFIIFQGDWLVPLEFDPDEYEVDSVESGSDAEDIQGNFDNHVLPRIL